MLTGGSLCLGCNELTYFLISAFNYLVIDSPGHHLILVNLIALMSEALILIEAAALQALLHTLSNVAALPHYGSSVAGYALGTRY